MGGISFGPKYMENQFNIPTWQANIILGKINYCIFSITGKTFNSLDCEWHGGCLIRNRNYLSCASTLVHSRFNVIITVFCVVFCCFVCPRSVWCSQCCLYPWIVHSWSPLRFSLAFTFIKCSIVLHQWIWVQGVPSSARLFEYEVIACGWDISSNIDQLLHFRVKNTRDILIYMWYISPHKRAYNWFTMF